MFFFNNLKLILLKTSYEIIDISSIISHFTFDHRRRKVSRYCPKFRKNTINIFANLTDLYSFKLYRAVFYIPQETIFQWAIGKLYVKSFHQYS